MSLHAAADGKLWGFITGSTCGDACWHAREEVCRCSCGGANHGILNKGGERPTRTCKIDGHFYELAGIVTGRADEECWADVFKRVDAEKTRLFDERFPGIDTWAYGDYRAEKTLPVLDRKVSPTQAKWSEVAAMAGAYRLVWARPVGTTYQRRADRGQS